jgi:dipeptidyl aminopeptidase/acylaminoacyl peptidase
MKKNIIAFIILFSFTVFAQQVERREQGNLVIENIPSIPQSLIEKMYQYQSTRSAGYVDWLTNGDGMLIATRFGETAQIHRVKTPGGAREQITFFPEPIGGAAVCPNKNSNGFLFLKDTGGNEYAQIYYFNMTDGSYKMLSDGKSLNGGIIWSNKGDKFVFTSTKRNGRDYDIYITDLENYQTPKMILSKGGSWGAIDWNSDDTKLIVSNYISANESYIYILDIGTGNLEQINPSSEKISYSGGAWSKDGKGIYFASDENSELKRLRYYDLSTKRIKVLAEEIQWDIAGVSLSKLGDKLAFTVNEDGIFKLYIMDTKTMNYVQVPKMPLGTIGSLAFSEDGNQIALTINTPQSPGDIYALQLKDYSLVRWTFSEVGGLNTDNFVVPELIHYPTFDIVDGKQRMIPAFIYKPKNKKGPFPVLIDIHGGPEGQYIPGFSSEIQYRVVELGVAVICPNVRGSTGYGKTYLAMDNGFKREESVQDIGKLLDWIEKQPELDSKRVGVIGGSYGGYMVLASMTNFNERLACGIDIVGISNFVTFLENTSEYRRDLRRVEYGDERDPKMREFLLNIAPTNNANKITKPLFVVQGLNDPRVPASEAEQIVSIVRKNGGTVWYLLAKDEGHGFRKKSNRDYYGQSIVLFLEKYLIGK